jgi:hypothetical protein
LTRTNRLHIDAESSPDSLSPLKADKNIDSDILSGSIVTPSVTIVGDKAVSPPEPPNESEQQPLQFPRKLSAAEKSSIAMHLVTISLEDAQAMLDELADAMATGTIKTNPLRWFRGLVTRQKAGTFIPAGGIRISERRNQQQVGGASPSSESAPRTTNKETARASLQEALSLINHRSTTSRSPLPASGTRERQFE